MDYTTFKNNLNKISRTRGISVKSNMDRGTEEYKKKYRRVGKYLDEILEGTSRYEIYKILPLNRFVANFNFYHTQGWNYVIDDAIENYKTGNYIV